MQDDAQNAATDHRPRVGARRPEFQVVVIAALTLAAAAAFYVLIPDRGESIRSSGPWAFILTMLLFGLFEYTVFNVQFKREGISFALSEIPIAFALVFLTPLVAVIARLPLTLPVLVFARKNSPHKLAFNVAIFMAELTVAMLLFRGLLEVWGVSSTTIVVSIVVSLIAVAPLTSVLISLAISRFEGGAVERIIGEIRATWWMYTVNAALAAMTVALALIDPALSLLAALPAAGVWYVLRSYGQLGQELRDLDAVHGFAGRVGSTLDLNEIGETAVSEVVRLTRGVAAALVRFGPDGAIVHVDGTVGVALPRTASDPGWDCAARRR